MKKIIFLCLSAVLSFAVYAQNNKAVINFKKTTHDFGNIKEKDGLASYTFEFTNKGTAPLIINDATASCGCTTPEWSREPIAPGKSGKIKVAYNPQGRPEPFDKTITVNSNATEPVVVLHIKGNVEQKVLTIEEQYPIAIGALRLKNNVLPLARLTNISTRTETLEVFNTNSSPIIISFENVPAHIRLEAEPVSVGAKQKGLIRCTYLAALNKTFGPTSDKITVKANGSKGTIEIQATIDEDISNYTQADFEKAPIATVANSSKDFGAIKQGESATVTFDITNQGKSDMKIHKLTPDCKCITATISSQTIKPGQTATVKAQLNSKDELGAKYYNIIVTTNAPRQQSLNLFMVGSVSK